MSFDLWPKNGDVSPQSFGGMVWQAMLDTGIGLVIGAGKGGNGMWFYCGPDPKTYSGLRWKDKPIEDLSHEETLTALRQTMAAFKDMQDDRQRRHDAAAKGIKATARA